MFVYTRTHKSVLRVVAIKLLTPDLCLEKHVTAVSAGCFFQLRQLRQVRRSLDDVSMETLVHAFVTSRIDYCNGLLAGAPKVHGDGEATTSNEVCSTYQV